MWLQHIDFPSLPPSLHLSLLSSPFLCPSLSPPSPSLPQTPLLVAAKKGSFSCVKLLLYHGANINHSFKYKLQNQFAWHVAKKSGHSSLEQYLRKCRSKCCVKGLMSLFVIWGEGEWGLKGGAGGEWG